MKSVLRIMLRVYSVFCMCLVTILLITGIIVWNNFGKITAYALGKVVDSYNTELNGVISGYLETSVPDGSIQFVSLNTVKGGGLQAAFSVSDNLATDIDIGSYQEKTNEELIAELGITAADIPVEILPLLSMVKETLVIDLVAKNGNNILNRAITSEEIMKVLSTR